MSGEIAAVALLSLVLFTAMRRPHGLPEAVAALPAAAILVGVGAVSVRDVGDELDRLLPVLLFLAGVLVLAHASASEGLFDAAGQWLSRTSDGGAARLLLNVFVLSAVVTSVLSLDATVVLLTPVVLTTVKRMGVSPRPHVYAAGHLANSASLLLPMGNLTNLLAIAASGLTLVGFARLMALPFVAVLVTEYVVFRVVFHRELDEQVTREKCESIHVPKAALAVLAATLAGFVATSFTQLEPYWLAIGGAVVLGAHALGRGYTRPVAVAKAVDLPFLLFVCCLAVVVRGVVDNGLGRWDRRARANVARARGLADVRADRRPARQSREQLARPVDPAGSGVRRRAACCSGGPDRSERRTEPHLHRFSRDAALAARPRRRRPVAVTGQVHLARHSHGARCCGSRDRWSVGEREGAVLPLSPPRMSRQVSSNDRLR